MRRRYLIITAFAAVLLFATVAAATATSRSLDYVLEGVNYLENGRSLLLKNPVEAQASFADASASFDTASGILLASPWYGKLLTPVPPFRWHVRLMRASNEFATIGKLTSELSQSFPAIPLTDPEISVVIQKTTSGFTTWESKEAPRLNALEVTIDRALEELDAIPSWLFFTKRQEVTALKQQLLEIDRLIPEIRTASSELQRVLGKFDSNPHQIVVLFQNSAELRPCGGFPGSFAYLNASGGVIRQFRFAQNVYKYERPYEQSNQELAPLHVQVMNPNVGFLNSCLYAPGFLDDYGPEVYKRLSAATTSKPEGIIYVNSSILKNLLQVTGPIILPNGVEANSETISTALTEEIEKNYFNSSENIAINEPKTIINDLIPVLLNALAKKDGIGLTFATIFQNSIRGKELQFWFKDSALQESMKTLTPLDSPPKNGTWLKLVNSNITGLKSSENTTQETVVTISDGLFAKEAEYQVAITRNHRGTGEWPDGPNRNYLEAYIPKDAVITKQPTPQGGDYIVNPELLEKRNVKKVDQKVVTITEGNDWKRIGWWATTEPGTTTEYQFSFTLPKETYSPDRLTYLKQSGSNDTLSIFGKTIPVTKNIFIQK